MLRTIVIALTLALVASVATIVPVAAWHVDTSCESIDYDGYTYRVYQDGQLIQDWTKGDTAVSPGTYLVKFTNGEKRIYTIEPCPRLDVTVRGMLCGDPRASWKFVNKGDVPATFAWTYLPGKKTATTRKTQYISVSPGATRKVINRWVRGWVAMRVFDPNRQRFVALPDASYRVGKTLKSSRWGTNGCPAGLTRGLPDFRKAHVLDTYRRVVRFD